jgi:hypothetical protein
MRLSPFDPLMHIQAAMAYAHFLASRYDIASSYAEMAIRDNPTFLHSVCISAASNAFAGRLEPAQKAMARALEFNPGLRASNLSDLAPFSPSGGPSHVRRGAPQGRASGVITHRRRGRRVQAFICLSAGQSVADPGDDTIPLTVLGRGVVDQHAVDEAPRD